MPEEVIVYTECLSPDRTGDLVQCLDCGAIMLVQIGEICCGECDGENLVWYDEDNQEWSYEELEAAGFVIIEK